MLRKSGFICIKKFKLKGDFMNHIEVMKQALEALEGARIIGGQRKADEAIAAIKQSLAEAESESNRVGELIDAGKMVSMLAEAIAEAESTPVQTLHGWWAHTNPVTGLLDVVNYQLTQADKAKGWVEQEIYTTPPAAKTEPWKRRFEWLASQHWVEPEATFHLSLEETDDFIYYHKQLIEAIDAKMGIKGEQK